MRQRKSLDARALELIERCETIARVGITSPTLAKILRAPKASVSTMLRRLTRDGVVRKAFSGYVLVKEDDHG